jgi:hypothetical protein
MPSRGRATGHGGARKGAGRKRNVLPPEVAGKLGAPPTDKPLKLARWYSAALSELLWLYLTTGKYVEMLRETKAAAAAMGRVMPLDIQLQAAKLVKADDDELTEDEDPDEEVREPRVGHQAVRRDAP